MFPHSLFCPDEVVALSFAICPFVPVHGSFREMTLGKTGITWYQEHSKAGAGGPSCPSGGCDSESGMRARVSIAGPQQFRMLECLHMTPCHNIPVGFRGWLSHLSDCGRNRRGAKLEPGWGVWQSLSYKFYIPQMPGSDGRLLNLSLLQSWL